MGFDNAWAFLSLIFLVPIIVVLRRSERLSKNVLQTLKNDPPDEKYFFLRYASVTLFIVSLSIVAAGPYIEPRSTGDYIVLVDTSRSMQARHSCNEATFLDRAKKVIFDVLTGVPEGRFGIVAFDRLAFPVTQVTFDHGYLKEAVDNALFIGMTYQATRTDIANALSVVAQKKRDLPESYGKVRYVILLSDGYLTDPEWQDRFAAPIEQLRWANIRVLAVGIGNRMETPIPITSTDGDCSREIIEIDGQEIRVPLRNDVLTFVASETRGRYFEEGETGELVDFIRSEGLVDASASRSDFGEDQRKNVSRMFLVLATIGLLLFLIL